MGTNDKFKKAGDDLNKQAISDFHTEQLKRTQRQNAPPGAKTGGCGSLLAVLALNVILIFIAVYYLF
jgi:hypothetical protein